METIRQDLKFAARSLLKRPAFSLMAIVTLALGIGANTAIFSIVNALLLRPLPFDEPHRLAVLFERDVMGNEQRMSVAPGNFLDWQQGATSIEHMTAHTMRTVAVTREAAGAESERVAMCQCSGNVFAMLRVSPVVGRAFRPDEDRFGAARAVVIGFDLWQRQFGGSPNVVGQSIRIDNEPYEVIGVAPRGFMYPNRGVQVWLPLLTTLPPQQQIRHDLHYLRVVGRVRSDVSMEQARAEIDAIAARYKAAHPQEATGAGATVTPLHEDLVSSARRPLTILFAAVACVLLIACFNIANLMLTRTVARTREIGIRTALGASRGRIIRQLVTESVLLGLAGGARGCGARLRPRQRARRTGARRRSDSSRRRRPRRSVRVALRLRNCARRRRGRGARAGHSQLARRREHRPQRRHARFDLEPRAWTLPRCADHRRGRPLARPADRRGIAGPQFFAAVRRPDRGSHRQHTQRRRLAARPGLS